MSDSGPTQSELTGKSAVVTGGAQGLGLAIARELAAQGATVTIADIQSQSAHDAATAFVNEGLAVDAAALDISDSTAVTTVFEDVVTRHGRLDVLVNNAGTGQIVAPVVDLSDAEWHRVIATTLTGTFYCCRAAGRIMETAGSGCIVNVASINGQNPAPLVAAYNAAKAGVVSLTRTLALELAAYGVRVNAVAPGPVYTDFNRTVMAQRCEALGISEDQMIERVRQAIPLGRWGEPPDIARVVAFLCGIGAAWMTGEVVRVSGGLEGVSAAPPRREACR